MRFLVGLAAAVWTLKQVGPVGWFLMALVIVTVYLLAWLVWANTVGVIE